ncbi:lyase family protein [Nocardioides sp.]|uniref:lyase family protein n=1 Tax=Nocardioides sp. TaxID=35761 RepID=UPI003514DEA0
MSGLLWPGAHRAAGVLDDDGLVRAMVRIEAAWSAALVDVAIAPPTALVDDATLTALLSPEDVPALGRAAEVGGNPVIPLVALLRERLDRTGHHDAARWLHRGLTSQDVVDSALLLGARDAVTQVRCAIGRQVSALTGLVATHRDAPALARTLTQPAVPTTLGLRFAGWLGDVLDADDDLAALAWPAQLGGAAGTSAALVEIAGGVERAEAVRAQVAAALGLEEAAPWHTRRRAVTRIGDALVAACDAWGHVADDVLVSSRAEIGELAEGEGGGSSTMPGKANPVRAVLLRRTAIAAPPLAATLHAAAGDSLEERTAGGWHAEWETLALLARRTLVAAEHAAELLTGLQVHPARAAAHLAAAHGALAEQRAMAGLADRDPSPDYLGTARPQIDAALARAAARPDPRTPPRSTP